MKLQALRIYSLVAGCLLAAAVGTALGDPPDPVNPSDTFFNGIDPDPQPNEYQWAMQTLDLPAAWGYSRGHAYVGIADLGIRVSHPDLQQNFRPQLSYDVGDNDSKVEERYDDFPDVINYFGGAPTTYYIGGHGTHVAGIIGATPDNDLGVAGACWNCSLMIGKFTTQPESGSTVPGRSEENISKAIEWLVRSGAQVINVSAGGDTFPTHMEDAIEFADSMDVVVVASSGNKVYTNESDMPIDYPARDSRVIGIGATDHAGDVTEWTIKFGDTPDLVAPGDEIVSTFGEDMIHNRGYDGVPNTYDYYCSDGHPLAPPQGLLMNQYPGYGLCTGTSMAAPHVSGIAAILRSVNPLLNKEAIRSLLTEYANTNSGGYLVPNALNSVKAALGTSNGVTLANRLTPLFELYSSTGQDYLFTSSPQAASSALYQTLPPQPPAGHVKWNSSNGVGGIVPGYEHFPGVDYAWWFDLPKASFYVFTTHRNPFNESRGLVPLYRLSRQKPTSSNAYNVDHAYATRQSEVDALKAPESEYDLDGVEGYIFSTDYAQPTGTVPLYSRYNPTRDDHVIVPEPYLSTMTSRGYTVADPADVLGYVFLNRDSDGDTLIDGFELILDTNAIARDTDGDGLSDGIEINRYPYSDPLVP